MFGGIWKDQISFWAELAAWDQQTICYIFDFELAFFFLFFLMSNALDLVSSY